MAAGVYFLAGVSVNANPITIVGTTVVIGGGGTFEDYTYTISTANTSVSPTDASFININDFGAGTVQANTLPGTWTFTQPNLGPNIINLGVDNPAVPDAVFTFTGAAQAIPDGTWTITIRTLFTGTSGASQWTTFDRQTSGMAAGQPEAAVGFVRSPVDPSPFDVAVPDGGATVALLGLALLGVAGLRRKLTA
jgi:hypothetical protein